MTATLPTGLHDATIPDYVAYYLRQRRRCVFLPVFVCLSVCLLARLLKNACIGLNEMLRVDRYIHT